jgi:arylsulfatase A-like enzyme
MIASVVKSHVRAAAVLGVAGGLLLGYQEAFMIVVRARVGPRALPMTKASDFLGMLGIPMTAYAVGFGLLAALGGLLIATVGRRWVSSRDQRWTWAFYAGLASFAVMFTHIFFMMNRVIVLSVLMQWARMYLNLRIAVGSALAAYAVYRISMLVFRRTSVTGTVGVAFTVMVEAIVVPTVLLWLSRNAPFWGRNLYTVLLLLGVASVAGVLGWATLRSARSLPRLGRDGSAWFIFGLGLAGVILTGWGGTVMLREPPPTLLQGGKLGKPNLLLITIDTLRADRLSCYGYERISTPGMDKLATEGVLFENAQVQSPWTLSSLASILTSTYPSVNGVLTGYNRLDDARETLPEVLKRDGYVTQAFVTNGWLETNFGLNQGFDGYYHPDDYFAIHRFRGMTWERIARRILKDRIEPANRHRAEHLSDKAIQWLRNHQDRSFFLWLHYIDPHDPYAPPAPYDALWDADYQGRWKEATGVIFNLRIGQQLTRAEMRHIEALYDGEVAYCDEHVGRVLNELDQLGLTENTLVVLSSDHGEEFWDHGGVMHGHTLYEECLNVPLLMRFPGRLPRGIRVQNRVRLLDVVPTVCDLLNVEPPSEAQGTSLLSVLTGAAETDRPAYAEALLYFGEKKSVEVGPYKLIKTLATDRYELYDAMRDPTEDANLAPLYPALRDSLIGVLTAWQDSSGATRERLPKTAGGSTAQIDPDLEARLKAMGYLQ